MSTRDLLQNPVWRAEELGVPIPDSEHAVSMALPRWRDVVGYEEKKNEVMNRIRTGYPRFVIHPLVRELASRAGRGQWALPFPSARVAEKAAAFVCRQSDVPAEIIPTDAYWVVATQAEGERALKAFWQHTGLIISSRQASALLQGRGDMADASGVRRDLRRQLANLYDCAEDDVFLAPTGMAAHFAALEAVQIRTPGRPTAQLGFPYVDTLKIQQLLGHGGLLLPDLLHVETELDRLLRMGGLAACFAEVPGNPLLGSVDLRRISPKLRAAGVPLVADDVVATPINVDFGPYADLIATSLTKYIVGTGDAMGGALICNPRSPLHHELKGIVRSRHEELYWGEDAAVVAMQARTFPERMQRHNASGLYIANRLRAHPAIERVWYPKWEFNEAYEAVRRPAGGYSSLITFLPKAAEEVSERIFDALEVCKGPSLGTVFTLACPFTLLAHYTELEWAESCGVSRFLIRLSIGLEEPDDIWGRIERAFKAAGL